ncbi:snoRNP complex protein nop56 [Irineochytrium annulatum]|nr:snoRNP complex protein nop56 [Irineochytrium annulatum]
MLVAVAAVLALPAAILGQGLPSSLMAKVLWSDGVSDACKSTVYSSAALMNAYQSCGGLALINFAHSPLATLQSPGFLNTFCSSNCSGAIQTLQNTGGNGIPSIIDSCQSTSSATPLNFLMPLWEAPASTLAFNYLNVFGGIEAADAVKSANALNIFACSKQANPAMGYCMADNVNRAAPFLAKNPKMTLSDIVTNPNIVCSYCFKRASLSFADRTSISQVSAKFYSKMLNYSNALAVTLATCPPGSLEAVNSSMLVLFESASGYALFERIQSEEIGQDLEDVQQAALDLAKFGRYVKLKSFVPFKSAAHALENLMDVTEGVVHEHLKAFLEMNMPAKSKKSASVQLGVEESTLAGQIKKELGYDVVTNETVKEICRGLRYHAEKLLKQLRDGDFSRAQLGLGHSYSRAKVKFNVNRADNMIIQSINLLDQMDKDVNLFSMRVREWYSWHFPELVKIVSDNALYARCVKQIKNKSNLTEDDIPALESILSEDATKASQIYQAAQISMGTDISDVDMENIEAFADRVISLTDYRKKLHGYLVSKMHQVAPNLSALIGEMVGARLIAHAGSLTNLSKYPASTVQILGAEKALFRALKTRGNTPKYGLIYHSTFIGRAGTKNKGRISRVLANKCSIASRIDCFQEKMTSTFGEMLREQVEERLKFYEDGTTPRKNAEVMGMAVKKMTDMMDEDEGLWTSNSYAHTLTANAEEERPKKRKSTGGDENGAKKEKKSKKKKPVEDVDEDEEMEEAEPEPVKPKKKKSKVVDLEMEEAGDVVDEKPKKKKKSKKSE